MILAIFLLVLNTPGLSITIMIHNTCPIELTKRNITRISNKIMKLYNQERPHINLDYKTPIEFEKYIQELKKGERPVLKIYQWN